MKVVVVPSPDILSHVVLHEPPQGGVPGQTQELEDEADGLDREEDELLVLDKKDPVRVELTELPSRGEVNQLVRALPEQGNTGGETAPCPPQSGAPARHSQQTSDLATPHLTALGSLTSKISLMLRLVFFIKGRA